MSDDAKLNDEPGRLAALRRYEVPEAGSAPDFEKITRLVARVLGAPMAAVTLIEEDRQLITSPVGMAAGETPRDVAFCDRTIRSRGAMVVEDAASDPRFADNPAVLGDPHVRSYAGVPLSSPEGYNLGALCVVDTKPRAFTPEQLDILSNFAALVIDDLELRTIARRDFLTGAITRRAFVDAAERCRLRQEQHGSACTLVTFDIDHFKRLNDSHGHPFGDEVLKAVAAAVQAALRPGDLLGRLGGEEFAVLLTETEQPAGIAVADRLRLAIAALAFPIVPGLQVTASFGVAGLSPGHDIEAWMAAADAALYDAKHGGRNRTAARKA